MTDAFEKSTFFVSKGMSVEVHDCPASMFCSTVPRFVTVVLRWEVNGEEHGLEAKLSCDDPRTIGQALDDLLEWAFNAGKSLDLVSRKRV